MVRALITGITGFVGSHLAELLLSKNYKVYGISRWRSDTKNIEHIKSKLNLVEADLNDSHSFYNAIQQIKPEEIYHLAAQSFVPTSWIAPADTMKTNVIGTINLFEAVRKAGINPKIQVACCYSEDTRLLTQNGLKTYDEIEVGEKVLSYNLNSNRIEWKKIINIFEYPYFGDMYHFNYRSVDLLVTPNHKMLIRKGKKVKFVEARNLTRRTYLPLGSYNGNKTQYTLELYYLVGLFIGDGYVVDSTRTLQVSGYDRATFLKECRDGKGRFRNSGEKKVSRSYKCERLYFAIPENDKARKKCILTLRKLGISFSTSKQEIYVHKNEKNKEYYDLFRKCGKYAKNKQIPHEFLEGDREQLYSLFEGLIDSDGHYRKGRYGFTTVSKKLLAGMIELTRKIGKWITFSKQQRSNLYIKESRIISSECFYCSITNKPKILTVKSGDFEIVPYNGSVWCVEVEDNHNFLVERNGKITFCGNSSEEYGLVNQDEIPIKETSPLRPLSPYGVSKVAQDMLSFQYFKSYGMKTVVTRGFNHTGPRRGEVFVCSNFAKQIVEIEKGLKEPIIKVGNLDAIRDFTDVRDMVKGYYLALQKGIPGERYNICSGKGYKISELLDILLRMADVKIKIEKDQERMRPSDVPILIGDNSKFKEQTGWKPEITFEKTLKDLLNYWRDSINVKK